MVSRGEISTYTIDLSLPASKRYEKIAVDFKEQLCGLPKELDETLRLWLKNSFLVFLFKLFAFLFIRRLYSAEEMEEVKGIAKISGANVRFLVALNVMLDSLMCCTGGGVLVNSDDDVQDQSMMHLRLLDWDLDGLRDMLLVLEYVNSNSSTPTRVIARSITYAGYVGILTGVRENLSLSMNFRPESSWPTLPLLFHQFRVLAGFSPSIATIFRSLIIAPIGSTLPSIVEAARVLSNDTFSPCYIILSNGFSTLIMEKYRDRSYVRSSSSFIVQTNHDVFLWQARHLLADHDGHPFPVPQPNPYPAPPTGSAFGDPGMYEKYQAYWGHKDSIDRYNSLRENWMAIPEGIGTKRSAEIEDVKSWMRSKPVGNTRTHFMCLMDPINGEIPWLERGREEAFV
ncbi:f4efb8f9-9278-40ae-bf31-473d3c0b0e88-CDS [Sclerotinia trifoliorum]|uniref:ceramidase n=1 Tax=Sclerotinia trifoliorum TaxID=28548 RepID=A0A8H2W710_9HELO|nr:f4efb8f9-9278-40ae-bf31-473d3c0b0e88-CDS [Sclerotinia trifoliorum]